MQNLKDPYVVVYRQIHAIADPDGDLVEILERSACYGGSAWARYHYTKGPLIQSSRALGEWFRYIVRPGTVDLDGNPRIGKGQVDIGAYEYLVLSPTLIFIQ